MLIAFENPNFQRNGFSRNPRRESRAVRGLLTAENHPNQGRELQGKE
jgi:hypothetical protein